MRGTLVKGTATLHGLMQTDGCEASSDVENRDDTSIASSKAGSPSPAGGEQSPDHDYQAAEAETSGASGVSISGRTGGEKRDDERTEYQYAGVQEVELDPEPVPGLLSGRKPGVNPRLAEGSLSNGSVSNAHVGPNGAEIVASKDGDSQSESQTTDNMASNVDHAVETTPLSLGTSGNSHVSSDSTEIPNHVVPPSHNRRTSSPTGCVHHSNPAQALIDPSHVRPSLNTLSVTAQEFSEAKTIILDLLGWGVPPEYLMNCGLAREAIYYAFTELNLRLPSNFDADGIIPYEPPPHYLSPPVPR